MVAVNNSRCRVPAFFFVFLWAQVGSGGGGGGGQTARVLGTYLSSSSFCFFFLLVFSSFTGWWWWWWTNTTGCWHLSFLIFSLLVLPVGGGHGGGGEQTACSWVLGTCLFFEFFFYVFVTTEGRCVSWCALCWWLCTKTPSECMRFAQCARNPRILFMIRGFSDSFGLYMYRTGLCLAAT